MKVVYVAHPLGAGEDRERNRQEAVRWCAWLALHFDIAPVADWIILSGVWSEEPELRSKGLAIDLKLIERVDEVWMVGRRISPGMKLEATRAVELGKPVRDLTGLAILFESSPDDEFREAAEGDWSLWDEASS